MDFFNFDDIKMVKKPTILWYNQLPSLTKLFRLVEFCLAIVLFTWIFNRLPFALRISGHFFRQFAGVIASPLFVFFLCNAIIVTLFIKSERFSGEIPAVDNAETLLYGELLKNHKYSCSKQLSPEDSSTPPANTTCEVIEFQDKEMIMVSQVNAAAGEDDGDVVEMEMFFDSDSGSESASDNPRVYRRWKSEKIERKENEKEIMKLRRSETEKFINTVKSKGENGDVLFPGEELSDEEFQRAVDDFIAKHLRFRRQESLVRQAVFQN